MSDNGDSVLRLSQGHLNVLEICPRKFQHLYLDRLGAPTGPQQQEKGSWGDRFHVLMQQRELNLPIAPLLQEDASLNDTVQALVAAAPDLFVPQPDVERDAEHWRSLLCDRYLLTVVYDLLIARRDRAEIVDWKTYPQPRDRSLIANNWQTRLYLYVLAATSPYPPEQLTMTYWFVRLPHQPESATFVYDRQQHEKTQQDLERLLSQLTLYLERYHQEDLPFPQISAQQGHCDRCAFAALCQRIPDRAESAKQDWQLTIAEIAEISL
jgi:hypothetical protein